MTRHEQKRLLTEIANLKSENARLARQTRNLAAQVRYYKDKAHGRERANRLWKRRLLCLQYAALGDFLRLWFFLKDHDRLNEIPRAKGDIVLEKYLGGAKGAGQLGEVINQVFDQVLTRMQREIPDLKPEEKALYCYMVIQLGNDPICHLLNLREKVTVSVRKNRLRSKIGHWSVTGRWEYLELIDKKKA